MRRCKWGCRYKEFRYGVLFLPLSHTTGFSPVSVRPSAISSDSRVVLRGVVAGRSVSLFLCENNKCHSCHSDYRLKYA